MPSSLADLHLELALQEKVFSMTFGQYNMEGRIYALSL